MAERKVYYCSYCEGIRPQKRSKTCGKQECVNKHLEESMKIANCVICNKDFKVKRTIAEAKYCSDECRNKRHSKNCEYCGETFRTRKNHQKFCSTECAVKKNLETMVTLECDYCGEEFERPVMGVSETYLHNFCSKRCRNKHYTQLYYPHERKYGPDWYIIRKEVLDYYDNICQRCGVKNDLHVHHIIPRKYTDKPINSLETLLPLCDTCHKQTHKEHDKWYAEAFGDEDIV